MTSPKSEDHPHNHKRSGKWTQEEHAKFLKAIEKSHPSWREVSLLLDTRTPAQVRTHARKYFQAQKRAKAQKLLAHLKTATSIFRITREYKGGSYPLPLPNTSNPNPTPHQPAVPSSSQDPLLHVSGSLQPFPSFQPLSPVGPFYSQCLWPGYAVYEQVLQPVPWAFAYPQQPAYLLQ